MKVGFPINFHLTAYVHFELKKRLEVRSKFLALLSKVRFKTNMVPLSTPQRLFRLFCVRSVDETGEKWEKAAYTIFTLAFVLINAIGLIASAVFFQKYVSSDLELSLYALFTVFGFGVAMYGVIFVFLSRYKLSDLFEKLSKIYDASKMMVFQCSLKVTE